MSPRVLVTGGAGFIGKALCRALLAGESNVRVLDSFLPQVHGTGGDLPLDLKPHVELVRADVRDIASLTRALHGTEIVVHLAAQTGTGQSMYEISRYFDVNVQGTANLLQLLQSDGCSKSVRSVILASSRAIYGEGSYKCPEHGLIFPGPRSLSQMISGDFEVHCPHCMRAVEMIPTGESAPFRPVSVYGLTKQIQEQALFMVASAKGITSFALRYQNVYGPWQSLKNPYTGILAVFANLARQGHPIDVYEDGRESRDFVYIDDVVCATMRAVNFDSQFIGALNVGSGRAVPVTKVAKDVATYFGGQSDIRITGAFRLGDIRHNCACTERSSSCLGFIPSVTFDAGLRRFLDWAATEKPESQEAYRQSVAELYARNLMGEAKIIDTP